MMKLIKSLKKNIKLNFMEKNNLNFITGFKFAEISDVIFSGVFIKSQIDSLNLQENIEEHIGDDEYIFVKKKKFNLQENDIIFCKTESINDLFRVLRNHNNFKNIKLITHQSDLRITKKLFNMKPKCISKWYSINVDYSNPDLIPIPIGLANFHTKNLNEILNKNSSSNFSEHLNRLYLNFNPNTNFSHRKSLFSQFKNNSWAELDESPISHEEYQSKLANHKFTLAPWGNGIDTHRFWEALYSGSIPVTKNHLHYLSFKSIPKLLVEDYRMISKEFLEHQYKNILNSFHNMTFEELDFNYWKNKICDHTNNIENSDKVNLKNNLHFYYRYSADLKHLVMSKLKIFNRLRRYFFRKFNY